MPLPSRKKGEAKNTFVSRCMSDSVTKKEFPDQKQRSAVCLSRASLFSDEEQRVLADAIPFGNKGGPLGTVPKKKKRKKDRFRLVNDDEAGSSVTGEDKKEKKKKKSGSKPTKDY